MRLPILNYRIVDGVLRTSIPYRSSHPLTPYVGKADQRCHRRKFKDGSSHS